MPTWQYILIGVGGLLLFLLIANLTFIMTAKIEPPGSADEAISIDGKPSLLEGTRYMEYRIGINIGAAPEKIWALLTDSSGFPKWNSTVISIHGDITGGSQIKLKAKVAPDRTFPLTVAEFAPHTKMVWQDGNRVFRGQRTFLLEPKDDGSTDVTMAEVLTGAFLPMIAPKLPDFRPSFEAFASDLKKAAEAA